MKQTSLAERLIAARGNRDRREVARAMGYNEGTLRNWESGAYSPRVIDVEPLAKTLGVRPEWLVFGRGSMRARAAG